MPLKLHHIVVLVKDLQKAIDDYVKLGFTVTPGGMHFGGISENALILMEDGTYLELLAIRPGVRTFLLKILYKAGLMQLFRKSKYGMTLRFYGRAFDLGEGIIDFAILSDNPPNDFSRIKNSGIFLTKPLDAGRYRPDGRVLRWKMLTSYIKELPFLITDLQPAIAPNPMALRHVNTVSGLKGMVLLMPEPNHHILKDLQNLLDVAPEMSEQLNHTIGRFVLSDHFIDVLIPNNADGGLRDVQKYGLGLYAVKFKSVHKPLQWNLKLSHGLMIFD